MFILGGAYLCSIKFFIHNKNNGLWVNVLCSSVVVSVLLL